MGETKERRNFYRIDMETVFEFSLLNPETVEVISANHQGILQDLSAGGLSFATDLDIPADKLLEIKLVKQEELFLPLGKIIRQVKSKDKYIYALEFVHMDTSTQDRIVRLIYEMQRKQKIISGGDLHGYE